MLGQSHLKVATGVISGPEYTWDRPWLQTTAPLNGGNSGGPLLNSQGEVIGIAAAGVNSASNVGYAIPINEFRLVAPEFEMKKFVRKPFLGLEFYPSSKEFARLVGNPEPGGVYVSNVYPNSLAQKVGIRPGDALYELDGHILNIFGETSVPWRSDKLTVDEIIHRLPHNQKVSVVFYRNGKRHEKKFTTIDQKPYPIRKIYPDFKPVDYEVFAGLVIMPLADNHLEDMIQELKKYIREEKNPEQSSDLTSRTTYLLHYGLLDNKTKPVLVVSSLLPGSLAAKHQGITISDIIEEVNGIKVATLDQLRTAVRKSPRTGYLTIKTHEGALIVLPFNEVLKNETVLSKDHKYPITPFVSELLKKARP